MTRRNKETNRLTGADDFVCMCVCVVCRGDDQIIITIKTIIPWCTLYGALYVVGIIARLDRFGYETVHVTRESQSQLNRNKNEVKRRDGIEFNPAT